MSSLEESIEQIYVFGYFDRGWKTRFTLSRKPKSSKLIVRVRLRKKSCYISLWNEGTLTPHVIIIEIPLNITLSKYPVI